MWKKAETWDSRSYSTCALTPPFFLRNFAHQKTDKHKGMVVESKAYTLPFNLKISVTRFFLACSIVLLDVLQKQQSDLVNSLDYSVDQTSLQAIDSNKWNASHNGFHHTCQPNGETCYCREILSIGRKRICLCSLRSTIDNCKITNSNRRALGNSCKRLYFNYFKERLVHFYGTVVNSLNYERLSGDKTGLSWVRVYEQYRIEFHEVIEEGPTIATICNITELSNHYK